MAGGPPKLIALNRDDYHARDVGRTIDGRQFILTTPFEPAFGHQEGREFLALYLFDQDGEFLEARIDDFGPRKNMDHLKRESLRLQRLRELGRVSFERIEIRPFVINQFGLAFGLIVRAPDEEADTWAAELQPGNYMAFFPPWDSGVYDT